MDGCVSFVDEVAAGCKQRSQIGKLVPGEEPEDGYEIEASVVNVAIKGRPGHGFFDAFAAKGERDAGFRCTLRCESQTFVGRIGEKHAPTMLGEPDGVAARASGEVEGAGRRQSGTGL